MKAIELAVELNVDVEWVKSLLGKPRKDSELTEEEIQTVVEAAAGMQDKAPAREAVRVYISTIRSHVVLVEGNYVKFNDYRLVVVPGGKVDRAIRGSGIPEISELVDAPLADLSQVAAFRRMLDARVFSGPHKEPAYDSGTAFLQAFFHRHEMEKLAKAMTPEGGGLDAAIELVVRSKSLRSVG